MAPPTLRICYLEGTNILTPKGEGTVESLRAGDTVEMLQSGVPRTVIVHGLSLQRGPAGVAQALYAETPDSLALRERLADQRRVSHEPAMSIEHGRPTKRDRRHLDQAQHQWDNRWSASIDPT